MDLPNGRFCFLPPTGGQRRPWLEASTPATDRRSRPRALPTSLPMGCSHQGGAVPCEVRDGRESGTAHLPGVQALPVEEWSPISLSVAFLFLGWLCMMAALCPPPPSRFGVHALQRRLLPLDRDGCSGRGFAGGWRLAGGNGLRGWHWHGGVHVFVFPFAWSLAAAMLLSLV